MMYSHSTKREKENNEKHDLGPHRFTPANDITRPPTSSRCGSHSLSPTAICRIRKNSAFPSQILRLYGGGTRRTTLRATSDPHETHRSRRRVLRAVQSWTRVWRGSRENETKRSADGTQLALRAPECLAGLRVQVP